MFLQRALGPSRNTPPPVQPLERDLPKSPVLMLPSGHDSPPKDCLALTWMDEKQDKVSVSPSKSTSSVMPYNSPDTHSNSMFEQSRAYVFDSPSGGRTVCLQKTVCYTLPPNAPLASPVSPSVKRGSPGETECDASVSTSRLYPVSVRGFPGSNPHVDGSGKERKSSPGSRTPPRSILRSGSTSPQDQADDGQQQESQVRNRHNQKGWKDLHLPKDDRSRPGRNLAGSDRYRDILEQDHPEETLSRGFLGSCFCRIIPLIIIALLVAALLLWGFGAPLSLLKVFASTHQCPDMNMFRVRQELERGLIGQPIASKLVVDALSSYRLQDSETPLIMFFHGSSGVGKSHTANIITESVLEETSTGSCVHLFSTDLFLRSDQVQPKQEYTQAIEDWVNSTRKHGSETCCVSFFIFDELQKDTPQDLTHALGHSLSKLRSHSLSSQSNAGKQVFIIMTMVGSQSIREFLSANMKRGLDRHSLSVQKPNWQEPWKHLTANLDKQDPFWTWLPPDAYVRIPFLPLERAHVKQCARRSLERKNLTASNEHLDWVADQLVYFPDTWPIFSTSGCKKVAGKVDLIRKESHRNTFDFKKPF